MNETLEAATITELEKKARAWTRKIREGGSMEVVHGWDRERVEKTEKGYSIINGAPRSSA